MKSALFVDFDNVFSLLRQLHAGAAEQFARHPDVWIQWLTQILELPQPHAEGQRRRLLVRRCYLNPAWYQTYRHAFLRAGFEIVDCPPVTSQGKTSTDIHLVLDAVDLLQHETHYDEFIVFSADADFTPLLRKLRRHDRRTTVLAIGFPSAAYQAAADLLIPERVFVNEALWPGGAPTDPAAAAAPVVAPPAAVVQPVLAPRPARSATAEELAAIANRIWQLVDESPVPVSSSALAARLKAEYPEPLEHWNGSGAFRAFFNSLHLARLVWISGSGGRLIDPARHEVEGRPAPEEPDSPWSEARDIFDTVREVCALTKAPMLSSRALRSVLQALADELAGGSFHPASTAQQTCARCLADHGLRVRQRDVGFLIKGLQLNGHVFGQGQDDVDTLAARVVDQVLFLCAREQMVLDESAVAAIRRWVMGPDMADAASGTDRPELPDEQGASDA